MIAIPGWLSLTCGIVGAWFMLSVVIVIPWIILSVAGRRGRLCRCAKCRAADDRDAEAERIANGLTS